MKLTISLRNKIHTHTHTHTHRAMWCTVYGLEVRDLRKKGVSKNNKKKTLLEPQRRAHRSEEPPDYWVQPTSLVQNLPKRLDHE